MLPCLLPAHLPVPRAGNSFEKSDRRKGRPAHLRSPDDTPLRDANRDVMLGVLTARWVADVCSLLMGCLRYALLCRCDGVPPVPAAQVQVSIVWCIPLVPAFLLGCWA